MSAEAAIPAGVAGRQPIRLIFGALLLVLLLASLDQTIVSTALPTIRRTISSRNPVSSNSLRASATSSLDTRLARSST